MQFTVWHKSDIEYIQKQVSPACFARIKFMENGNEKSKKGVNSRESTGLLNIQPCTVQFTRQQKTCSIILHYYFIYFFRSLFSVEKGDGLSPGLAAQIWAGKVKKQHICPSVITTTEVPLSTAPNPNCSSGAAQWQTGQTGIVLGSYQVWMCERVPEK